MKQSFNLVHDLARQRALEAVKNAPAGFSVTIAELRRSAMEDEK